MRKPKNYTAPVVHFGEDTFFISGHFPTNAGSGGLLPKLRGDLIGPEDERSYDFWAVNQRDEHHHYIVSYRGTDPIAFYKDDAFCEPFNLDELASSSKQLYTVRQNGSFRDFVGFA